MIRRAAAFSIGFFVILYFTNLLAGNHEVIHPTSGHSIGWSHPQDIPYWADAGPLGKLNNDQARALLQRMMNTWEDVESAEVGFTYMGDLPHDVTEKNIADYIAATSCGNSGDPDIPVNVVPVVFDSDGKIIEYLTGAGSSGELGGLATLRCFTGSTSDPHSIYQGMIIINGQFIDDKGVQEGSPEDLSINSVAGIILHELGHLIGLDHSVVNDQIFSDISDEGRPADDSRFLPVMLPTVLRNSVSSTTLHPDDVSAISTLYSAEDYLYGVGDIEGEVVDSEGREVRKVNVIARRTDDPLCEAISALSGKRCVPIRDASGEPNFNATDCDSRDRFGDYVIEGLTPGDYTVEVEELASGWIRNGMYPPSVDEDLPGDAEFYNKEDGADEDPYDFDLVAVYAGQATSNIDFILGDSESSPDQLDRIPLGEFESGPATRCVTDPVDYTILLEDPDANLVASLDSPAPGSNGEGSWGGGGCQLDHGSAGSDCWAIVFVLLGIFFTLRGVIWERNRA